eukprot:TRINITY_DN9550_c0_g1_i1.p1 TRINITY_DN9550_c0_g1~~TRINITY_DN9550_c0_g1_i1.p1  ORF type:complete len:433 (+),score=57.13 TRINITY_DN9550_c0_g1_i1:47-1300(+)
MATAMIFGRSVLYPRQHGDTLLSVRCDPLFSTIGKGFRPVSMKNKHLSSTCVDITCSKTRGLSIVRKSSLSEARAEFSDVEGDDNKRWDRAISEVNSSSYRQWDAMTTTIAGSSTVAFLLMQLPQIVLNARNLSSGNKTALFAVGWLGQLTGLLGNLSLLSYFAKKKETGAVIVQTVGVVSTYAVLSQLAMAGAMPSVPFIASSVAVGAGLIFNFLNYNSLLPAKLWRFWEDLITVGGVTVLPQVMWSTFVPYLPQSMLPGVLSFAVSLMTIILARSGKLSKKMVQFVESTSGWTATLLFMWMPVAQMWTNYLNPNNIRGLSTISLILSMIGNGLMIPRALFTRDIMWFTGSGWAALLHGWGNTLCVYMFGGTSKAYFVTVTSALILWIGLIFWKDSKAYGLTSPFHSLAQLVSSSK